MPRRKSRQLEEIQSKATNTSKQTDSLKKFQKQLYNLGEKPESSQLPNQSHKNIGDLIKEKQEEKKAFESSLSDLRTCIEVAKQKIEKIKQTENLSIKTSINKQLAVLEKYPDLKNLIAEDIEKLEEEEKFVKEDLNYIKELKFNNSIGIEEVYAPLKIIKQSINDLKLFEKEIMDVLKHQGPAKLTTVKSYKDYEKEIMDVLKHQEPTKLTTIKSYKDLRAKCLKVKGATDPLKLHILKTSKMEGRVEDIARHHYLDNPSVKKVQSIAEMKSIKDDLYEIIKEIKENFTIFQDAKNKFDTVIPTDYPAIKKACEDNIRAYAKYQKEIPSTLQNLNKKLIYRTHPDVDKAYKFLEKHQEYTKSTLQNINQTYLNQLLSKPEIETHLEAFQQDWNSKEAEMRSQLQGLENQSNKLSNKLSEELSKRVEDKDMVLEEASQMLKKYVRLIDDQSGEYLINIPNFISFYDLIEKNITHRLSDSLDELEKQSREALILLEEEIKELQLLHSQRQSEQSAQLPMSIEKPSPANKLQEYLDRDADVTDQRKPIVTSYIRGLFEKSHHQSLDDKTTTNFYEKNIKEAKQIGEYLEQMHFAHKKIRDDVIQFAIHLKHEFGFPLHQANIDADFNIIKSDPSKDGSSSTSGLDIDRQGRILKDGRVQRVYLIGLQDSSKASSSDTQPEPMALLAIQSTDTPYPKYGAGTPLPTGGVVDVLTAQYTTRGQPNLYQATLAIETLQETHNQKEIDMQTLELFETETVKNPHTKASLYDVTTFIGKVKDSQNQAPSHDSKEYRETTGPCMVDLEKLISAVKDVVKSSGNFCPSPRAMIYVKRQIARQILGEEKVPRSDEVWRKNDDKIRWADFHEYSTSMNMFAKYLVVAYREKLRLAGNR